MSPLLQTFARLPAGSLDKVQKPYHHLQARCPPQPSPAPLPSYLQHFNPGSTFPFSGRPVSPPRPDRYIPEQPWPFKTAADPSVPVHPMTRETRGCYKAEVFQGGPVWSKSSQGTVSLSAGASVFPSRNGHRISTHLIDLCDQLHKERA